MYYNILYRIPFNTEFRYSHASPGMILWDKKQIITKKRDDPRVVVGRMSRQIGEVDEGQWPRMYTG